MKSERRHELRENVLYTELGRFAEFLKRRGMALAWGALGVAVVVLIVVYVVNSSASKKAKSQTEFDNLVLAERNPNADPKAILNGYQTLSEQTSDKRIAALACVRLGNMYARTGAMAREDSERKSQEDRAAASYNRVLDNFADQAQAVAQAHFGLAKLAETQGKFPAAKDEYQKILAMSQVAGEPIAAEAANSLKALDDLGQPVRFAASAPAPKEAATEPTTSATTQPETSPASSQPASAPAGAASAPAAAVATPAATQPATADSPK